jgi:hypothetical protein
MLMIKFGKSEKIKPSDFLFRTVQSRQFSEQEYDMSYI